MLEQIKRTPFIILLLTLLSTSAWAQDVLSQKVKIYPELQALEKQVVETVNKTKDTVVAIVMKDQSGQVVGSGSGVIVTEKGLIYTAAHVVDGFENVYAIMSDESEHEVVVLGMNRYKDAAVCRMRDTSRSYPYAEPGNSDTLKVTDWVIAMGHGRGYDKTRTAPVRFGRVRAHNPGRFITTDCPLIGGDSGGPLFDIEGKVVGINSSINGLARFNVHAGVSGFQDDLLRMRSGESWGKLLPNVLYTPETPLLGVKFKNKGSDFFGRRRYTAHIDPPYISDVSQGGPAQKGGIKAGDLIRVIGDEEINSRQDVEIALGRQKVGNAVKVVIQRGRELLETKVTLGTRKIIEEDLIYAPPIRANEDSPYVKEKDKALLDEQVAELFSWTTPLEEARSDTYVQLYSRGDIRSPLLNATIIKDGMAIAPLSAFETLPEELFAWRPGLDALPVKLIGGYLEHDLAVLSIQGLTAETDLVSLKKEVKVGEFLSAISKHENEASVIKLGVVSVEKRELTGRIGVYIRDTPKGKGVLVTGATPNQTAYKMGIRRGTIIYKVNGNAVNSPEDLKNAIDALKIGDDIEIEFERKGRQITEKSTLGGKGSDGGRIDMMDQLGKNSLSKNRDSFQTVIQSDMLVEPEECGAPIYSLDGGFVGIAISDAGRNKTYILPASSIAEALQEEPQEIKKPTKVKRATASRDETRRMTPRREAFPRNDLEELDSIRERQRDMFERFFQDFDRNSGEDIIEEMNRFHEEFFKELRGR